MKGPAGGAAIACCVAAAACGIVGGGSEHGEELFDLHCATCHETSNPDLKKQPPKLERLFAAKTLPSGAPATDEQVRNTIIEGLRTMPAFQGRLSAADVNDLIQYLHTLK
jgi:mono/diheme cytochrome c family protein